MSNVLLVVGAESYTGTQITVNAELASINSSGAVSMLVSTDNTIAGNWAQTWAQGMGIPWIDFGPAIETAIGDNIFYTPVRVIQQVQPAHLLTIGTNARTISAEGYCTAASGNVTITSI